MKSIFKTLLRYKTSTLLNLVGLSCAFATFIVISMQIKYDITYNSHIKNGDKTYMLYEKSIKTGKIDKWYSRPNATTIKNIVPEIKHLSIFTKFERITVSIIPSDGKEPIFINPELCFVEKAFIDVFSFEFIEGNPSPLKNPNSIIISEEFAKKHYGNSSPIGKIIKCPKEYIIGGVFKTIPNNSSIKHDLFANVGDENLNNSSTSGNHIYMKAHDGISEKQLEQSINDNLLNVSNINVDKSEITTSLHLSSMDDIRYKIDNFDKGQIYIMTVMAICILVLAFINFINFATSMIPLKMNNVNLRKIVGATQTELRVNMILEAVTLTVISFAISIVLIEILKDSPYSYIISDITWETNRIIYFIVGILSILIGIISGIYPAFYATSFQPALIIKGNFSLSASGTKFRKILIGFQFFTAISFIAGTIFIQLQHDHMLNRDTGYIKDDIIHVNHGWYFTKQDQIKEQLLKNSQFKDVTFSYTEFGTNSIAMGWGRSYSKGSYNILSMPVAHNFLDFFEIKIDSGRNFIQNDNLSENGYFIMSRLAMDKYGFIPGEQLNGHRKPTDIIGICENISLTNAKVMLEPFAFYIFGKHPWAHFAEMYVKVSGDPKEIMAYINETYKKIDPHTVISVDFMSDELDIAYGNEKKIKQIMSSISAIAIIIALMGVFGLISFDSRYRRKEIGLRRINGATVKNILAMFSMTYVKIVFISFSLSVPIVYYLISQWLENFPYRIDIYWWVFPIALIIVLMLTTLISVVQSLKAATENPVNAIKGN